MTEVDAAQPLLEAANHRRILQDSLSVTSRPTSAGLDRRRALLLLAMIVVVGMALRSYNVTLPSFWFDEAFSWRMTEFPLVEMVARTARDNHPPLYFLLLKAWAAIFGASAVALRGLSVLLGGLTIAGMYLFVVEAFGRQSGKEAGVDDAKLDGDSARGEPASPEESCGEGTSNFVASARGMALLTAALVAVTVFQVRWAGIARMYTLGTALIALSSWALLRALRAETGLACHWMLYAILALAAAYTHYYALFSIAAQFLFLAGYLLMRSWSNTLAVQRSLFQYAALAGLVICAGFSFWMPSFLQHSAQVRDAFWAGPLQAWNVPFVFYQMFIEPAEAQFDKTKAAVAGVACLGVLAALLWRGRAGEWYIFTAAVVPLALSLLISAFDTNIFHARYFLFAHLFFLAGLARLVWRIPSPFARASIAVWIVANGILLNAWFRDKLDLPSRPGAKGVVAYLAAHRQPGEPVVVCSPLYYFPLVYHAGSRTDWSCYDEGGDGIVHYEGSAVILLDELITQEEVAAMNASRVWIIDMAGGGWGRRAVPVPDHWQAGTTERFREAYGPQGMLILREYRTCPQTAQQPN